MARYTTYKSGIVSGSNLISANIDTSRIFGTASYVLSATSASFAKNASGSWLSSSFGTSLSALSVIGFNTDGTPLTVFPAQDSLYLTVVDRIIGWTSIDSAIAASVETEDVYYSDFLNVPNVFDFQNKNFSIDGDSFEFLNLAGSSLYTFAMTSYTTSSI